MSLMGGGQAGPAAAGPMEQLMQMRMAQQSPQPIGPGQGLGAPQLGAPPAASPEHHGALAPNQTNDQAQNALNEFAKASTGRADTQLLGHHLRELQKMYPKLLLADHKNGHAELVGPAQEQFLAAAYGRTHGAKVAHVRNEGRGQRLHLEF